MSSNNDKYLSPYEQMKRSRGEIGTIGSGGSHRSCPICHNTHIIPHPDKPDIIFCVACGYEQNIVSSPKEQEGRTLKTKKQTKKGPFIQSIDQRKKKNQLVPDDMKDYNFGGTVTSWEDLD